MHVLYNVVVFIANVYILIYDIFCHNQLFIAGYSKSFPNNIQHLFVVVVLQKWKKKIG